MLGPMPKGSPELAGIWPMGLEGGGPLSGVSTIVGGMRMGAAKGLGASTAGLVDRCWTGWGALAGVAAAGGGISMRVRMGTRGRASG